MLSDWIVHNSHSVNYRSPFGAVAGGQNITLRLQLKNSNGVREVLLRTWYKPSGEQKIPMVLVRADMDGMLYETTITAPPAPGLLWYYFIIRCNGETFYYGNNPEQLGGIGRQSSEVPPSYQVTLYRQGAKTPQWFKEAVMYQIFVDRFYNGNDDGLVQNAKPGALLHMHWNDSPFYVREMSTGRIAAYDFFGGNLQGVLKKLSYLKELGVTVIYLNPIFDAPSNHKYDTADYKNIDPMFGSTELFSELCRRARDMGISIILDGVFSHTGSDSIYFNREGNYPDLGAYQSTLSPYYPWYRFSEHPDKYESWWGIDTLPNVEELEPSYQEYIINGPDSVLRHWLRCGIKGWRLDVVDELPDQFVKRFSKVLKECDADAVLIGEVWEDASHKESYGLMREYFGGDELDSVMNYPFRTIMLDFMLGHRNAYATHASLMSLYENYPRENFYAAMNLLGSHDVPRVLTMLGELPGGDSTTIEQTKIFLNEQQRRLAVDRLKLVSLIQMTFPGVPCIYYGDEAGMEGHTDPLNRRTYPWGREDQELLSWYKQMTALRNRYAVLKTGDWVSLPCSEDVYGYIRVIRGSQDVFGQPQSDNLAVVLVNRDRFHESQFMVDVSAWDVQELFDAIEPGRKFVLDGGRLYITLQPLEGMVLVEKLVYDAGPGKRQRQSGILLHPTSLPSPYGIGDLGPEAYAFVDFLAQGKQSLWQVLPLNPLGLGGSPYQSPSAFAGNPLLISPDELVQAGWLEAGEVCQILDSSPLTADGNVQFEAVKILKDKLFRKAYQRFKDQEQPSSYPVFMEQNRNWLEDYALFVAVSRHFGNRPWNQWDEDIKHRRPEAVQRYQEQLADEIHYHCFLQYLFFTQWQALKEYANSRSIRVVGDLPIFVAHDSSDVWAHPGLFALDDQGYPSKVAGVPPDYFSETGQLWGNPHYRWQVMAEDDYHWWRERIRCLLTLVDAIRIDHFRGFDSYWEVNFGESTAIHGRWMPGPGAHFFAAIERHLGKVPFIAEDLGIITPEVWALKDQFGYPGMKVLHFAFGQYGQRCLEMISENTIVYTGTHDNDTTIGWYQHGCLTDPDTIRHVNRCLRVDAHTPAEKICWRLMELALASRAHTAVLPLQDVLCLGSDARMNTPGTVGGNWQWRLSSGSLTPSVAEKLAKVTMKYQRARA